MLTANVLDCASVSLSLAQGFHEDEPCHDIAVLGGSLRLNVAAFFIKPARNPIQSFVGQLVRIQTILSIKVTEQTLPDGEIALTVCIHSLIEPSQQASK